MPKRLFAFLLLFLPLLAWAQEVYQHPATGLRFPQKLADFERSGFTRFDDERLGVQVGYMLAGLGRADFYIFDFGVADIGDGIDSEPVRKAYEAADHDVHSFAESGRYLDLRQTIPLGSVLKLPNQKTEWLVAAYTFRRKPEDNPMMSWLLLTGYRKQFLKIRYTHLASDPQRGRQALDGLLEAFWDANKH